MSQEYILKPFGREIHLNLDYAAELNEQQYAAVTAPPGPSLVIAGAGSGKTRTLTYRVAYLLEQGIPPERILLLTFTNKAAGEMMHRVSNLLGQELRALWGGTFHSIGARILRSHPQNIGYARDFTILDRDDAGDLIKLCLAQHNVDAKDPHCPKADVLAEIFSMAGSTCQEIPALLQSRYQDFEDKADLVQLLHQTYIARKKSANSMDFDDLLVLWLALFRENPDIAEFYQRRFQFILVDEYQDTNRLQSDLVDLLASRHGNVMVVGDDAQSIYAWRGANFANIMDFPRRYSRATVYKIETNYRSTPEILAVANAAIAANTRQFAKLLAPARKSGLKPALVACTDAGQQAAFVAQRVSELVEEGANPGNMAVLYRSHFHALELQLELTRRQIPFAITSGIRFFEQAHIKDVTAYLKLAINPRDEISFKRLALILPGVGAKSADKLWQRFDATHRAAPGPQALAKSLQACALSVPKKSTVAWAQFTATMAQLDAPASRKSASQMLRLVMDAGYKDYLRENHDRFERRLDDIQQLSEFAFDFGSVEEFLTQLALLTNVEAESNRKADDGMDKLLLSTIHQAKGLEFNHVFVIMLCEGLFPSKHSTEDVEGEEEERRLFYVAVTRAKDELYLCHPLIRGGFGSPDSHGFQSPSRFLSEIPGSLINEWRLR